ncbi:hypothetical protein [Yokenella regensburgei]|uniref:hypothetical protein n=1 Tax=Yokenella regensburgei TaxID=158877 RepID=UPI001375ADB0|nr:hypothetical protein [Yokenella regensburgei]KAF1366437.1 hypothetical protein FHR25_005080 [Yokenella regensburgei]
MAYVLTEKERLCKWYDDDGEFGPVAEGVAVFVEIAAPAIIVVEQQLCQSGNIHGAESTGRQGTGKERRR